MAFGAARPVRCLVSVPALVLLSILTACGPTAPVRTPGAGVDVSLPSQPASTAPLAVAVDNSAAPATGTYTLRLVDTAAHTVASLTPKRRSDESPVAACTVARLPVSSASAHRVFLLDGDSTLRYLDPDGTSGDVRKLGTEPGTEVAFAVAPDETRMALMTVVKTTSGFHEEVAVETLGGAGAVTLFTREASGSGSSGEISWPVGWHGGQLVLADGSPQPPQACGTVPAATGYDLVDPLSGAARLHFCFSSAQAVPAGPPVTAGVLCRSPAGGTPVVEGWGGTPTTVAVTGCMLAGALAPDGSAVAATLGTAATGAPCTPGDGRVRVLAGGAATATGGTGTPAAWLDADHALVGAGGALSVVDRASGAVHRGDAAGTVEGILPPTL